MLSKEVFGHILTYRGGKGLRGAMDAWGEGVREIEVEDPGVLLDTNTKMDYESLLAYEKDRQKRGEQAFRASILLSREEECFSALTADFLEAVAESGSMLGACQIRDISYSKGWKMLKIAEERQLPDRRKMLDSLKSQIFPLTAVSTVSITSDQMALEGRIPNGSSFPELVRDAEADPDARYVTASLEETVQKEGEERVLAASKPVGVSMTVFFNVPEEDGEKQ